MPDQFSTDLKEFGSVNHRIGELERELDNLRAQRDTLQRRLRGQLSAAHGLPREAIRDDARGPTPDAVRAVVEFLRSVEGARSVSDVAQELRINERAATNRLLRAEKAGLIEREARGRYRMKSIPPSASATSDAKNEQSGATATESGE